MTLVSESRVWSVPNFRRLWTASAASSFGSELSEIALPLLVIVTLSADASQVGWLRTAQFLPFLLVTLPIGVLADRWQRQRLPMMVGADLGRCALLASIPVLVWAGLSDVRPLYLVVFAVGTLTVLYQVADFALLPSVVRSDQLVDANGKISATSSVNEIAGRGLGGLLVQALSPAVAVVINALAHGLSAVCLRRIDAAQLTSSPEPPVPVTPGSPRRQALAGLRYAVGNRCIRALLGEATTYNLFNELFLLGLLLWMVRDLGLGPAAVGLVFTAGGLGSFLGSWFGSTMTGRFGYGRVLLVSLVVGNSAPLGTALVNDTANGALALLCVLFTLIGVGIGIANVHAVSLRQSTVPEHLRGQVNAAYRLISWGVLPVGATAGGLVAEQFGAQEAMLVGASGVALSTLWVALSQVRNLRSIDDATP